jgi:hypothetical protein
VKIYQALLTFLLRHSQENVSLSILNGLPLQHSLLFLHSFPFKHTTISKRIVNFYTVTVYCNKHKHKLGPHVFKFSFLYIFVSHIPSGRIVALGSTQTLTEIIIRSTFWGVKAAVGCG